MIYVIVDVTYDYYRFQDNLAATTSLKKAIELAEKFAGDLSVERRVFIPVVEDAEKSKAMRHDEVQHIWIQRFE